MPVSRNEYRAPNPKDLDTFPYIRLQRATDLIFTTPANVELKLADTANESTLFIDTGGTTSSYYRHRGSNLAESVVTDWSPVILYGDYTVRQQIISDCSVIGVVPSGIDTDDWDSWRDQTLTDMQAKGLGRPADIQEITATAGVDEWVSLNSEIRRVTFVEIWFSSTEYWTTVRGWDQRGRQIRIYKPLGTPYTYKVYGRGELRDLNDLDDELWGVLYWGMRWKYILKRQIERADSRPYMGRTRTADSPQHVNYQQLADAAYAKYIERVYDVLQNEGVPSGEGGR
jgi:hypothetical protein